MSKATRTRGKGDTPAALFPTRSPSLRALLFALGIALVLHAPLIPSRLFLWLQLYMMMQGGDAEELEGEVVLPMDLDLMDDATGMTAAPAPPPPPAEAPDPAAADPAAAAASAKEPSKKKPSPDELADAGTDAAIDAPDDAPDDAPVDAPADAPDDALADGSVVASQPGIPDAGGVVPLLADGGEATADAGAPDAGLDAAAGAGAEVASAGDAGAPVVKDPLSQAGGAARIASAKNPNVRILIAGDRLRSHQLGEGFGRLLRNIPQWTGFFAGSTIDPIKDIDHLLIAGPQLRLDSSQVVAVMDFNVPEKKVRDAVDGIVKRTNGQWLENTPVPAAKATADRAPRIFALLPGRRMLVILPASAERELKDVKSTPPFNKSSPVGIAIYLVSPARAFKDVVRLPDTLEWLRLGVTPTADGGADLVVEAGDKTPEDAVKHAEELTKAVELLRLANRVKIPFTSITIDVIDPTRFVADGKLVRATVHLTVQQLRGIMGFAEMKLAEQQQILEQQRKRQEAKGQGK